MITVKHSGSPASSIAGSYQGGNGKRGQQDALELYKLAEQGDQQARQQLFESWSQQANRMAQLAGRSAPVGGANAPYGAQLTHAQPGQAQLGQAHAPQPRMDYTRNQMTEIEKMKEAYEEARQSGRFTDDELGDLYKQMISRVAGIQPLPSVQNSPYPQGQDIGQTWQDSGMMLSRKPDGTVVKIGDIPSVADSEQKRRDAFFKEYDALAKTLTVKIPNPDDKSGKTTIDKVPTRDEIFAEMKKRHDAYSAFQTPSVFNQDQGSGSPSEDIDPFTQWQLGILGGQGVPQSAYSLSNQMGLDIVSGKPVRSGRNWYGRLNGNPNGVTSFPPSSASPSAEPQQAAVPNVIQPPAVTNTVNPAAKWLRKGSTAKNWKRNQQ